MEIAHKLSGTSGLSIGGMLIMQMSQDLGFERLGSKSKKMANDAIMTQVYFTTELIYNWSANML